MENIAQVYVGVDISKARLDVYLHPTNKLMAFSNSDDGINQFIEKLKAYKVEQVVCESSGGYEDLMLMRLRKTGYKVWQVEPSRIKSFARSEGKRAKTDALDARMIALFAAQKQPQHKYEESNPNHDLLHDLVKRRKDLTDMVTMERLRSKHPSQSSCIIEIQAHINFMTQQIKTLEERISQLVDKDDDLNKRSKIMESVPGIGKATSAILLAEMPELGMIEKKQASALAGVAPYTKESGQYRGKSFIAGGRGVVRSALYMAALVATRHNPKMKIFYQKLKNAGKKPKVALVAVMRKIIVMLSIMLKNKTLWNPAM
jgi:transposase